MPTDFDPITLPDLQVLAALAVGKLDREFTFPPFAGPDKIGLPKSITPTPSYGSGNFAAGSLVAVNLYAYKTIAGLKTYSWVPLLREFTGAAGSGNFTLTWNWKSITGPTAPEGYILVIPQPSGGPAGWVYFWQDIGNVETFAFSGDFTAGWKLDATLDADNLGNPSENLPCAHGAWLKPLNTIRESLCLHTDISTCNAGDVSAMANYDPAFGSGFITTLGKAALVSGPWCVSAASGRKSLKAFLLRTFLFIPPPGTGSISGTDCFTQVYDAVQFYFRASDAPGGVNITAQNQLLNFTIGSDPITDPTKAHWQLQLVSCSDGHIKIQDSGGGVVRVDQDVTAGTAYDFSFDVIGGFALQPTIPKNIDITFTTPAASAAVAAAGIEMNGDVQRCDVPDSYFEIQFQNPLFNGLGYDAAVPCTSCGQLTLTEQNSTQGVWVAKTLPTAGLMTYLDVDLPQYGPASANAPYGSSLRVPRNPALVYQAMVDNRSAEWPIYRDTDFVPDSVVGRPVTGSTAWQRSIATRGVSSTVTPRTIAAGGQFNFPVFVPAGAGDVRFLVSDPNAIIYVKANSFASPANFDATGPGGAWLSLKDSDPGFPTGTTWFYQVKNPTGAALNLTITVILVATAEAPNGTFFPTLPDDSGAIVPDKEGYSYHFPGAEDVTDTNPVPLYGYCVQRITLGRQPQPNAAGVALAPSAGTADLPVKIGYLKGFGFDAAGTFTELFTATIPAGKSSVTGTVFLPVLSGTPLAYQCAEIIVPLAAANFQPMLHSTFAPETTPVNGADYTIGYYDGDPWFQTRALLFFFQGFNAQPILLPVSAVIYNDLISLLDLL